MGASDVRADSASRNLGSDAAMGATRRCATCGAVYPADFLVCPKDATSLEQHEGSSEDPLIGEMLAGSFRVTRVLGEGGMGRVYEAQHVRLPKRFAVKVMHEDLASRGQSVARFDREAQAVARISSEHVVDVVDVVRAQGRTCIVTELLEGEELGDFLRRVGKLPLPTAIAICRQICRGLAAAHAVGVVHRDLKPSNLFLVKREGGVAHVKILDFGIAKFDDGSKLTQTGAILGTPAYMAPEQALGSGDVDIRADVYAVGAVLYRMLTGAPPFPEDVDPTVALTRLLIEDPRRPRDLDRSIPAGVEALIQRAMARSPEARPATTQELDQLLATFDTTARDSTVPLTSAGSPRFSEARIGLEDTVAVTPATPGNDAEAASRRARRARPAAIFLTLAVSVTAGVAVLLLAVLTLHAGTGRAAPSELETILIAVLTFLAMLFVLLGAMRVLSARWRSAPAIQRLGDGLRATMLWFLVPLGVIQTVWLACTLVGLVPSGGWLIWIQPSIVLVPLLLSTGVFSSALRQAGRV
jgi:eukaryotic-like serine/threonine-protein kinase